MSEEDWLNGTAPRPMLDFLKGRASDRKFRLFAVACSRRVWPYMTDVRSRHTVEVAERFADEEASAEQLAAAYADGERAYREVTRRADQAKRRMLDERTGDLGEEVACHAAGAAKNAGLEKCSGHTISDFAGWISSAVAHVARNARGLELGAMIKYGGEPDEFAGVMDAARVAEMALHVPLVHCVFGDPFRPVVVEPRWRTADFVGLAQTVYEDRAFDLLPILADALEDAGCNESAILSHCRCPGPHARGCWVVDLLRGFR